MTAFAKCFRGNYLPDLVVRHADAPESKRNRGTVTHLDQLNTICLRPDPLKRGKERYKKPPLASGKTVLVVDDICTQGFSFEAAGAYVRKTGANVVFVSLLKTLNRDYESMVATHLPRGAYQPNHFNSVGRGKVYPYRSHIADHASPTELRSKLRQYHDWDWPA
jgi:hypoxanthine phosphoribosyltransferase